MVRIEVFLEKCFIFAEVNVIPYGKQEEKEMAVDLIGGPGFDSRCSGMVDAPA